jgi:hypothetical protein
MNIDAEIVTDDNIINMLDTAGYSIGYWAREAEVDEDAKTYTIIERETGDRYTVSFDDLRRAYGALLSLDQQYVNRMIHGYFIESYRDRDEQGIETGAIDGDAADVLVQVAAFGQVVYG